MMGLVPPVAGKVAIRKARPSDVPVLQRLERVCFPRIPEERHWKREQLEAHVHRFPDGQFVAELDGEVVGDALNLRVRWEEALRPHTWSSITGFGLLSTHVPGGSVLYGTEIMVHPQHRRKGIGRRLYEERKAFVRSHHLRAFVAGGRIPGFERHSERMRAREYVARVVAGEFVDRVLTPQLRSGMMVVGVLPNYLHDPPSRNFATLLIWMPHRPLAGAACSLDESGFEV